MSVEAPLGSNEVDRSQFDAVISLGKNIGVDWHRDEIRDQKYHLSDHSRINVLAAGILYTRGEAGKIIFSSGPTAGEGIPSESQLMKDRAQQIWPSIPDEDIILEENSKQTRENAVEVKSILKTHPELVNVALSTVYFHMGRAKGLFARENIYTQPIDSNEVVARYFPEMMRKYRRGNLRERVKETLGAPIQLYLSPLAKHIEGRVRSSRS